jgi:molecular chaperone GrpE (heat shock protein)
VAENEHIEQLLAARARMVADRREFAKSLAKEYKRGDTERVREVFIDIQNAIDAIDRAIENEQRGGEYVPPAGYQVDRSEKN